MSSEQEGWGEKTPHHNPPPPLNFDVPNEVGKHFDWLRQEAKCGGKSWGTKGGGRREGGDRSRGT